MSRVTAAPVPVFDTLEAMPDPWRAPPARLPFPTLVADSRALADYSRACEFLYSYRGSRDTFSTYRRELEHFLQWCWLIAGLSLDDVRHPDIERYIEFLRQPPATWIGSNNVARFVQRNGQRLANPVWRPFVHNPGHDGQPYQCSQATLQAAFSVLGSFYNFLVQETHCIANPLARMRQKSKFLRRQQSRQQLRRLSPLQWDYVIEAAERMASTDPTMHERTLFIMNALFALYLRISELTENERWQPQMGHFHADMEGNWWFTTVGKGNKERDVSVSDDMLTALKRYRRARGLGALPTAGETTPLIHRQRGNGGIRSTRQIRGIVQQCFEQAQENMRRDGFKEEAERLAAATVHWLRHTGISEDVKHRPREHVRDDAGHGSSAVTDRYIDVERAERHASGRNKRIRG